MEEYIDKENVLRTKSINNAVRFFPLHSIFQCLFNETTFLSHIVNYKKDLEARTSNEIFNYIQSPHWKEIINKLNLPEDELAVPLLIYFDEFEPNNPLGSHKGEQKVGAVYVKFACIPDYMASKLASVFPALLFLMKIARRSGIIEFCRY